MAGRGRRSGFILIILALIIILGVVAAYLLFQQNLLKPVVQAGDVPPAAPVVETVDILVTTQNIPRGAALSADVLATIAYPKSAMVEGMFFTNIEDLVGKRVTTEVANGVPLTASMIAESDTEKPAYPSFEIPENFTAVSMPISKLTSVSYGVQPGDHVMVVGCMLLVDVDSEFQSRLPNDTTIVVNPGLMGESGATTTTAGVENRTPYDDKGRAEMDSTLGMPVYVIPGEAQRPRLVCQSVIQDAVVLGVGEFEAPEDLVVTELPAEQAVVAPPVQAEPEAPVEPPAPDLITLVVSPQDAVSMNYMLLSGVKLSLALRNPTDANPYITDAVTQQYLMDQKNIPLPAKLPYSLEPRVDVLRFPGEAVPSGQQGQ
ncbi:MAG TPA: SAF domain-containing protein [Anaerolineaceae bacterium]|nr:SAF domain-containing protein [Anaerolineaceae bacterium]